MTNVSIIWGSLYPYLHCTLPLFDHFKKSDRISLAVVLGHPIGLPSTRGPHEPFFRWQLPGLFVWCLERGGEWKCNVEPQTTHRWRWLIMLIDCRGVREVCQAFLSSSWPFHHQSHPARSYSCWDSPYPDPTHRSLCKTQQSMRSSWKLLQRFTWKHLCY